MGVGNGEFNPGECPVARDWLRHTEELEDYHQRGMVAIEKIDVIHEIIKGISEHTAHLSKLDNISRALVKALIFQTALVALFFGSIVLVVLLGDRGKFSLSPTHIDLERGQ